MKLVSIVGARPQFIKAAILTPELEKIGEHVLINTGQHYDFNMSDIFFKELRLKADYNLKIGSGSHGAQTGRMLNRIERVLQKAKPDMVVVYGDTNTTLAGALVSSKLRISLAHVEAGLRSYDRARPEEINRIVADHVSDILFAPTNYAMKTLAIEGLENRSYLVGDVMVELLRKNIAKLSKQCIKELDLSQESYVACTLHRPDNVDRKENLRAILRGLSLSGKKIVIPVHPRTRKRISKFHLQNEIKGNIMTIDPLGYQEMLSLMKYSEKVCTDSGGIQKEAYILKRPCITLLDFTEWIETVEAGWNLPIRRDTNIISDAIRNFRPKKKWRDVYPIPDPTKRICDILEAKMRK